MNTQPMDIDHQQVETEKEPTTSVLATGECLEEEEAVRGVQRDETGKEDSDDSEEEEEGREGGSKDSEEEDDEEEMKKESKDKMEVADDDDDSEEDSEEGSEEDSEEESEGESEGDDSGENSEEEGSEIEAETSSSESDEDLHIYKHSLAVISKEAAIVDIITKLTSKAFHEQDLFDLLHQIWEESDIGLWPKVLRAHMATLVPYLKTSGILMDMFISMSRIAELKVVMYECGAVSGALAAIDDKEKAVLLLQNLAQYKFYHGAVNPNLVAMFKEGVFDVFLKIIKDTSEGNTYRLAACLGIANLSMNESNAAAMLSKDPNTFKYIEDFLQHVQNSKKKFLPYKNLPTYQFIVPLLQSPHEPVIATAVALLVELSTVWEKFGNKLIWHDLCFNGGFTPIEKLLTSPNKSIRLGAQHLMVVLGMRSPEEFEEKNEEKVSSGCTIS